MDRSERRAVLEGCTRVLPAVAWWGAMGRLGGEPLASAPKPLPTMRVTRWSIRRGGLQGLLGGVACVGEGEGDRGEDGGCQGYEDVRPPSGSRGLRNCVWSGECDDDGAW
jgi:hypothetical protein